MEENQVIDTVDTGIVIFDREYSATYWNGWMAAHTQISENEILGRSLFDFFPKLKNPRFLRSCKAVFAFGNLAFFPQDPYGYLFSMKPVEWFRSEFKFMQQSCTIGPIRGEGKEIERLFVSIRDMTEEAAYKKKLVALTLNDELTGSYNRRFLMNFLEDELYRCRRYNRPFSVIMMDIDHFKKINDTCGHPFGDEVLKLFASTVVRNMRKSNRFARYGGEEFVCVLPETDSEGGVGFAEKIRKLIEELPLSYKQSQVKITSSFGVITYTDDINDIATLMKKVDDALYKAKESGRNRVVVAN